MNRRSLFVLLGFVVLIGLQGCASGVNVMLPATEVVQPDTDHATVTFMRPSSFAFAIKFGIWDGEQLVGVLGAKSAVTAKVEPGEHVFLGRAENWGVVKANVEAGKRYYVLVRPRMGLSKAGVIMTPIKADTSDEQLAEWKDGAKPQRLDPTQEDAYVAERLEHVRRALQNVADGNADFNVLAPEDAR